LLLSRPDPDPDPNPVTVRANIYGPLHTGMVVLQFATRDVEIEPNNEGSGSVRFGHC